MLLHEHLHLVLPEQGRKALAHITDELNSNGERIVRHYWFDTTDQLAEAVEARKDVPRIYMAMAGYDDAKRRKQENAKWVRSIYHDLDAGPKKLATAIAKGKPNSVYETQAHAVQGMMELSKLTGLVPTLINSSGHGLHVYWALDRDYSVEEAQPVMLRVKAAFKALGVRSDPAVPGDTARVLRPIGSLYGHDDNGDVVRVKALLHKPNRVYTLEQINTLIDPHVPASVFLPRDKSAPGAFDINSDILTYPQHDNSMVKGAEKCAALAEIRDAAGQVEEPLWRLMIGISKHCNVDGDEIRHAWSAGDKRYNFDQVESYADRWTYGPSTCTQFSDHCDACHTCPFAGKITSPIVLCRVSAQVEEVKEVPLPDPPAPVEDPAEGEGFSLETLKALRPELFTEPTKVGGFFFKEFGDKSKGTDVWRLYARVLEETVGADGEVTKAPANKHIASRLFWFDSCTAAVEVDDDVGSQLELVMVDRPTSLKRTRCHIPASLMADTTGFAKKLLERGVVFSADPQSMSLTKRYMTMEHNRVQNELKYAIRSRFGYDWHITNGQEEFVCAYGDSVIRRVPQLDADQNPVLGKNGKPTYAFRMERTVMHPALGASAKYIIPGFLPPSERGVWGKDALNVSAITAAKKYEAFVNRYYGGEGYENHRMAILMGLASPYMVFTDPSGLVRGAKLPANGAVVSLYSKDGGKGKSAIQKVIGAAFGAGSPLIGGDAQGATQHSRSSIATQLGVFPLLLDEVSQNDPKRQASEVQQFANGSGRIRARRDGSIAPAGNWSLITIMSANRSIVEAVSSSGENAEALLQRIVEFDFDKAPAVDSGDKSYEPAFGEVSRNGGAIGVLLTYIVITTGQDNMVKMCQAEYARVFKEYDMDMALRFYGRLFAAALVTNKMLQRVGINMFDEAEMVEGFRGLAKRLMTNIKLGKKTLQDTVADMLDAMSKHIAVTHKYPTRGGNDSTRTCTLVNDRLFQLPIMGRQVIEDGMLLIKTKDLAAWCAANKVPQQKMIEQLALTNRLIRTREGEFVHRKSLSAGIIGIPDQPRCAVYMLDIKGDGILSVEGGRTLRADPNEDAFLPEAVNE